MPLFYNSRIAAARILMVLHRVYCFAFSLPGCSRRRKTTAGISGIFDLYRLFILGRTDYVQNRNDQTGSVVNNTKLAAKHI